MMQLKTTFWVSYHGSNSHKDRNQPVVGAGLRAELPHFEVRESTCSRTDNAQSNGDRRQRRNLLNLCLSDVGGVEWLWKATAI